MTTPHHIVDPYAPQPFGLLPSEIGRTSAGWYPSPDGTRKYWDGESWLAVPDPQDGKGPKSGRVKKIVVAVVGTLVVGSAIAGGVVWKSAHDTEVRNEAIAASSSKAAADAAAKAAAEEKEAREAAAAEQARRRGAVDEIESAIADMAEEHVAIGFISGPILSVSCTPTGGDPITDPAAMSTNFECFVANQQLSGGRLRGFTYHATMNWDTGNYTYGFGPR